MYFFLIGCFYVLVTFYFDTVTICKEISVYSMLHDFISFCSVIYVTVLYIQICNVIKTIIQNKASVQPECLLDQSELSQAVQSSADNYRVCSHWWVCSTPKCVAIVVSLGSLTKGHGQRWGSGRFKEVSVV